MLTIPKQFSKISTEDLNICKQCFTLIKHMYIQHNSVLFSTHYASTWRKTTFFFFLIQWTAFDTVIKNNLNFQGLKFIIFPKTWKDLENGLITVLWLLYIEIKWHLMQPLSPLEQGITQKTVANCGTFWIGISGWGFFWVWEKIHFVN